MLNKICLIIVAIITVNSIIAQSTNKLLKYLSNNESKVIEKVNMPGEVYKITDKVSGRSTYKNLGEYKPKNKIHKTTVAVDTTVIYPDLVDTIQFEGMYKYWTTIDIGTIGPIPIIAGDVNENGRAELYGERYNTYQHINERSIYEYNPDIKAFEYKADLPWDSITYYVDFTQIYDINMDGKKEIFITGSEQIYDSIQALDVARTFKLSDSTNLPTEIDFDYRQCNQMNDPLWGEYDNREGTDLFYCGESCDLRVAAARYDKNTNSAETVFVYLVPDSIFYLAGTSNCDIDNDGFADLVTGGLRGDVVVFEYQEDIENYKDVWYGDAGTYNVYIHFYTNDIDKNGKKEFWVGGAAFYDGVPKTKLTCFEAIGNNKYEAQHVIEIDNRFGFDAYNGFAVDIDKDGTEEIGLCLDQTFMILKFNGSENKWGFDLFYLKLNYTENSSYSGALMYDADGNGNKEILIQMDDDPPGLGSKKILTKIYKPTDLVGVAKTGKVLNSYKLYQNYPNPFNPSTTISYQLPKAAYVTLKVYDVLGKEVEELVNENKSAGIYNVTFNADDLPSGLYFYKIEAGKYSAVRKMMLMK